MKIPFSYDSSDSDTTHTPDDTPSPYPDEGDKEDEPPSIGAYMEDPGVITRMPPVTDGAESNEEGEKGDRCDSENTKE